MARRLLMVGPMRPTYLAALLVSTIVAGCETDDGGECLPGDIDCASDAGGDGKSDGYDYQNSPARMAERLQYRLAELPKKGSLKTAIWKARYPQAKPGIPVAWADSYWPTAAGSHNARWQGATVKSPLEKYDLAFNQAAGCATQPAKVCGHGAVAAWETYYSCAGPAAKWQSKSYQHANQMHDGVDNNGKDGIDECNGSDGNDGVASWWGTCHAWSPAALMEPEPQRAVTVNGVEFTVGDIKALIQNTYDSTAAVMLGGRCNAQLITHDRTRSANDECSDVNPGSLHVVLTNFLGIAQLPLIEDRTASSEVWNQPVLGYEVTKQAEISKTQANACVGATGSTWTYNTSAKKLYEVRVTVTYLAESGASNTPLGFERNTSQDDYHYILELNRDGKVIGGRYCTDSTNAHVDFLWSPRGSNSSSNPAIDEAKVRELIVKSVSETPAGGGTTAPPKVFTAMPHAAIPDNDPTGITVDVPVTGVTGAPSLTVSIKIAHTYVSDLKVLLLKDGVERKALWLNEGVAGNGGIDATYALAPADVGAANGRWQLRVVDNVADDTGTVDSVSLSFQ